MSTSTQNSRIRVGIVGMRPHASWAAVAHLPALGLAMTTRSSPWPM